MKRNYLGKVNGLIKIIRTYYNLSKTFLNYFKKSISYNIFNIIMVITIILIN